MPELPEVETIVRKLREGGQDKLSIIGREIIEANVYWDKTIASPSAKVFKKKILGQKVIDVTRRAKYIHIKLTHSHLLIHLRMSGDVLVGNSKKPLGKYSRVVLFFDKGLQLSFENPRKFGRVWLLDDPSTIFSNLGPEPLGNTITASIFHKMLNARKRLLKPLLMDQKFIAGIGNIYADEALNMAKIHPQRRSNTIDQKEAKELLKSIRSVLKEGIRRNGASIDWVYKGGKFQNYFRVYQRTGEPCIDCKTPISRIVVGQRGTHLCPKCQIDPNS